VKWAKLTSGQIKGGWCPDWKIGFFFKFLGLC